MCPTNPITYAEASSIIHSLRYIPLCDFGTAAWKSQREWFELLNIASHYNTCEVQRGKMADDFVTALFIEHGKISVLIHEIIVVDTFRRKILPLVRDDLCATATGSYMYIQYEGILMNLIECLLFHEDVVLAMDEDACEFVEYCWKNVAEILNQTEQMHDFVMESHGSGSRSQTLSENSSSDSFIAQQQKLRFNIAMSSLSCLWFIIEKVHRLPLSVLNCILLKIDLPCGLAHVIEAQPWKVRIGGKELKYKDYEFFPITNPEDAHLLVPVEAHTWFLLHFLLCDAECRKKYCYTIHRKDTMTRVRRFLHDMILDQIPALTDVARALDEMSFLELPTHAQEKFKTSLVVEPVPRIITAATAGFQHNEDYRAFSKQFTLLIKDPETILQDAVRMSKWFDFH